LRRCRWTEGPGLRAFQDATPLFKTDAYGWGAAAAGEAVMAEMSWRFHGEFPSGPEPWRVRGPAPPVRFGQAMRAPAPRPGGWCDR